MQKAKSTPAAAAPADLELLCRTHCKKDNLVCQNRAHNVILFATSPAQQDRIIFKGPKSPSSPPQKLEGGVR